MRLLIFVPHRGEKNSLILVFFIIIFVCLFVLFFGSQLHQCAWAISLFCE
uniref:Uncharacterized protein n=1 Tax=Anguilla anguilla TaxID=7936 RepID=A0A0E9QJF6_ANGAN